MIHAFINIYTCYCQRCKPRFQSLEGEKGHGTTWHTLATKIEAFTNERLGLDVDIGIAASMAEEWYESGSDLDYVYLKDLDYDDIMERVAGLEFMISDLKSREYI